MIDLNYLNDLPKNFQKESLEFRYILSLYNEMKAEITYVKSTIEIENKSLEGLSKNISTLTKNFYSEISSIEDLTNLMKIEQIFIEIFDKIMDEHNNLVELISTNKTYGEISEEINDLTKGSFDNINALVKDLNTSKTRYKTLFTKTEKSFKELEQTFISKKKFENDEKNSFNLTMKDKIDEKILNILNEFEENRQNLSLTFDECKRLEVVLNELVKNIFLNSIKFVLNSIKGFKSCLNDVCEYKTLRLKKINDDILVKILEEINGVEFDLNNQEIRYNNLKAINVEFQYLMTYFSSNPIKQNEKTEDIPPEFNIEEYFNKNNFQTSQFTDHLLSFIYAFLQSVAIRKKQLTVFSKVINEIVKSYENYFYTANKLIKNLLFPKVTILTNCPFLIQITEFLRSFFELLLRKNEELIKSIFTNLVTPLDHSILRDINSDEVIVNQIFQKIQKEYNIFKTNLAKHLQNKEKVNQSIEKVKENIQKTSDDFSKLQKQILSLRNEEANINELCLETYKKYRKMLEECIDIVKKTVSSYREKEINKMKEFKENIIFSIKSKKKNCDQITEFLEYRNQINFENNIILNSVKVIYSNFSKEFDLDINEKIINDLVQEIFISNQYEFLSKKEVWALVNDLIFINKEEILQKKDFSISDFVSTDELNKYKEKLSFLKNNSRKISIKNININKKMHDEIFYIDDEELVLSNFSCALSDKILLQGTLYITNKKLVFYSWFNNSTLFGKTLIEIKKEDILEVDKHRNLIFDNMIYVKTRTTQFLFASLIYRDKCFHLIREVMFGEINPLNTCNNSNDNQNPDEIRSSPSKEKDSNVTEVKDNEKEIHMVNITNDIKSNIISDSVNNKSDNSLDINEVKILSHSEKEAAVNTSDILNKLKNHNTIRINAFNSQNKRVFQLIAAKDLKLGNISPSSIFNSMFHPDIICQSLGRNKNFVISYLETRQDYGFILNKLQEQTWAISIPKYIADEDSYLFKIADNISQFCNDNLDSSTDIQKIKYQYKFTHPILKKKFMGPTKLEVDDIFTIYFVSPMCLIVEICSYMSGFMMMDTFFSITQYKFDISYSFNDDGSRLIYDTQVNISFGIEFVKDNWFKNKIISEALVDVEEFIKNTMTPIIIKVTTAEINIQNKKFDEYLKQKNGVNIEIGEEVEEKDKSFEIMDSLSVPQINSDIPAKQQNVDVIVNEENYLWNMINSLNLLEIKYKIALLYILILLILFSLFPLQYVLVISTNLIILLLIYIKIESTEKRIIEMEENIKKIASSN